MNTKTIARFALRETLGVTLTGVALFWSAGEIDWLPAWALLSVISAWIVATAVVTFRHSPERLDERLGRPRVRGVGIPSSWASTE